MFTNCTAVSTLSAGLPVHHAAPLLHQPEEEQHKPCAQPPEVVHMPPPFVK